MSFGYDPIRIRALAHRTEDAIESTRRVRTDDPAAAEALRTVAALRRTLDDHWMIALRDVERSDAMVSWSDSRLSTTWWRAENARPAITALETVPEHLRPTRSGTPHTQLSHLDTDSFVELLADTERRSMSTRPPSERELDQLAQEVARRARLDADTADRLVELSRSIAIVGDLIGRADGPHGFTVRVLGAMTQPFGLVTSLELDRHRDAFESALASLVGDPAASLAALSEPSLLRSIATWHDLDPDLVESVTRTGLHDAVVEDPSRLAAGYAVLGELTELANGPLDSGIHAGLALGVATSMIGYVDTLAPAIRLEGPGRVLVVDGRHDGGRGLEVDLGTYDDVVDLFGVLLRDPSAQAAIGTVLGAYTAHTIDRLGAQIITPPGLEPVARFTDLVADASRTEQAELMTEAAERAASRRSIADAIGFGTNLALSATGVGAITRSIASRAMSLAGGFVSTVDPDRLAEPMIAARTYDLMIIGAIGLVAHRPTVRRDVGLRAIPGAQWNEIRRRLDEIEAGDDDRSLVRLERWIAAEAPTLHRYLAAVRSVPGMDELTEGRNAVGED